MLSNLHRDTKIIKIIGNIGAGKSTLLSFLANKKPDYFILNEPVEENPLLKLFYQDSEA